MRYGAWDTSHLKDTPMHRYTAHTGLSVFDLSNPNSRYCVWWVRATDFHHLQDVLRPSIAS